MAKIVVVVSAYNQPDLLWETLYSLQRQTFEDFHAQIFDDNSPKRLFDALPLDLLSDKRFSFYTNTCNKGFNGVMRSELHHIDSDYLLLLHHDDVLNENFLKSTFDFLEHERECTFAYTLCSRLKDGVLTGDFPTAIRPNLPTGIYDLSLSFAINCWTVFSCALIRSRCLKQIGYFETLLDRFDGMGREIPNKGESDLYLFCRLASLGPVGVVDQRLAFYRDHSLSNTNTEFTQNNHIQNNIRTYDMIFGDVKYFPEMTRLMAKINSTARLVTHESLIRTVILTLRPGTYLSREFSSIREEFISKLGPQLKSFILDSKQLGFPRQFPDEHIEYMYDFFKS